VDGGGGGAASGGNPLGGTVAFLNLSVNADTDLTAAETQHFAGIVMARRLGGLRASELQKVLKAARLPSVPRRLIFAAFESQVAATILGAPDYSPKWFIGHINGFTDKAEKVGKNLLLLATGSPDSTKLIVGLRRADAFLCSGFNIGMFQGETPFQDLFAHLAALHPEGEDYEILFLLCLALVNFAAIFQGFLDEGIRPPPVSSTSIPIFVSKLAIKMDAHVPLGSLAETQLEIFREFMNGNQSAKRQKLGPSLQAPPTPPAAAAPIIGATSGTPSFPPGKVFQQCYDFQRPKGCSRPGCNKDHILVKCQFAPNCDKDPNVCKFHHP
jgi:hypothetical protein